MTIELPVLRLGLAGFTAEQQQHVERVLQSVPGAPAPWSLHPFAEADAWWICGERSSLQAGDILRIRPAVPSARAMQLHLAEVGRPVAFTLPAGAGDFAGKRTFELRDEQQARAVLHEFGVALQPLVAQFGLARSLVDQYMELGPGSFDVVHDGELAAVVDMRGPVGLSPDLGPADYAEAMWCRRTLAEPMPGHFIDTTVSELMWNYAQRTERDLLPAHYRTSLLFFRRSPRLAQRVLKDAHLLLLRELVSFPGTYEQLSQRTGLAGDALSRALAALYYVGSITSSASRAWTGGTPRRKDPGSDSQLPLSSVFPSALHADAGDPGQRPLPNQDLTAPAPLRGGG